MGLREEEDGQQPRPSQAPPDREDGDQGVNQANFLKLLVRLIKRKTMAQVLRTLKIF